MKRPVVGACEFDIYPAEEVQQVEDVDSSSRIYSHL
jgi:hypothetical protein